MDEVRAGALATTAGTADAAAPGAAAPAGLAGTSRSAREAGLVARVVDKLFSPVDASSLGAFRILFGVVMFAEVGRYFVEGRIWRYYIEPKFLFTYELAPFVKPWPGAGMYVHFAVMGVCALGIVLGFHTRLATALFGLGYTYVFLLDKAQYNNHYYLISLLCLLMTVVRANRWASIDRWRSGAPSVVPFWNLFLLRAQVFLVYFFAGVAKLNSDWLGGEPMRSWLRERAHYPVLGPFFTTEAAAYFFSWGGAIFDLSIGFLLLSRRTLPIAFLLILVFNMTNHWLFDIGVFTFLMICATILFDEPDVPRRLFGQPAPALVPEPSDTRSRHRALVLGFLGLYLTVQTLLPLRHFLYPGNVSWTEEGHRFSWHMKLRSKRGKLKVLVTDPSTGRTWKADLGEDLTPRQMTKMAARPDMIFQYVHYLRDKLERQGIRNPIIKVDSRMSLNRRPYQHAIDPNVDLAKEPKLLLAHAPWLVQLDESLEPGTLSDEEYAAGPRRRRR
ncbi:MAG TPA: HTTM domain-containing protein [Candidatus Binatia bacterium]